MWLSDVDVESLSRLETAKWQQFGLSGVRALEGQFREMLVLQQREWHALPRLHGPLRLDDRARVMRMVTLLAGGRHFLEQPCWHLGDLADFFGISGESV